MTGKLDRRRYWRTVSFFVWVFLRAIWWEYLVRRVLGEGFVARGREARLRRWSCEFRQLAVEMTGVMIKLGQFVGARADILPPSVTEPLAGLHDEVEPEAWEKLRPVIVEDLGPIEVVFAWVGETPQGAASIGQAHRAQLLDGARVVVKVQRPGIENIVRTDLAALRVVARLAMRWQYIARRMDLPLLLDEFARVLWEELDYIHEAENAARFAENFAHVPDVYIPDIYEEYTTRRVLVMEDVTAIKISDFEAIEAAGVSRADVAQRLLDAYMQQVFEDRFFHADPHPGNLFIYPLPDVQPTPGEGHPFYLVFVDFGMAGHLTPQIVEGIRETLLSLFQQDVHRMVQSFHRLGIILPGADLDRVEEAMQSVFDRVWGMSMTDMVGVAYADMTQIAAEFGDVIYALPFQMPQDFVYLVRALGILSGMCTALDPDFNPWAGIAPYAQKLLDEEEINLLQSVTEEATGLAKLAVGLPRRADALMRRAERGDLRVQFRPSRDFQRQVDRLEAALNQLVLALIFAGVLLASAMLYTGGAAGCGTAGFAAAGALAVVLLWRWRPRW